MAFYDKRNVGSLMSRMTNDTGALYDVLVDGIPITLHQLTLLTAIPIAMLIMNWHVAIWAIVHLGIVAMPKALVLDGAILILALAGAAGQDRKKARQFGEAWHEWTAQTAFVPFTGGVAYPGTVALTGGTIFFFLDTWIHPIPAGFWRWIG